MALYSEGKGAVAGWISRSYANLDRAVMGVRVGGPNAGHTVYGNCPYGGDCASMGDAHKGCNEFGHPWALRQVPVAAVTNPTASLVIAAGSEVDPDVLWNELNDLDRAGYSPWDRLMVDASATVLSESHRQIEAGKDLQRRLGSTAKGIGAARAERIYRDARTVGEAEEFETAAWEQLDVGNTIEWIEDVLDSGGHVVVEGTQGWGLGLHTEYYPFVTSGDCRAIDFLAQAGISPWRHLPGGRPPELRIVVCFRPYPIRVAGNSGPMRGETSWGELELSPEFTTVTQKMRRVGEWNPTMVESAIAANGGLGEHMVLALTMGDHIVPALEGKDDWSLVNSYATRDLQNWVDASELPKPIRRAFWEHRWYGNTLIGTSPVTMLGDLR